MLWLLALTLAAAVKAAPVPGGVPDYVTKYETYFPSDIGAQVSHTIPEFNFSAINIGPQNLDNLNDLNPYGKDVYLTSKEGILALPPWFSGARPDKNGVSEGNTGAIVVVEKPDVGQGIVDAFYFFFYAYNQGNYVNVFGVNIGLFGNHVGDWEHMAIRFQNGTPISAWLSQHSDGQAFTFDALEKDGDRPVVYVGNGTHATWAVPGLHEHTIPGLSLPYNGLLTDFTDAGPYYDSSQSSLYYKYNGTTFTSYDSSPVNWLYFQGYWGDQQLPDSTPGQVDLFGQRKYSGGPDGPLFKDLTRKEICTTNKNRPCIIRPVRLPR